MRYILYPIYALGVLLFTFLEILGNSIWWITLLLWYFKLPEKGFNWKGFHLEMGGYDPANTHRCKCDLTIKDTLIRRLSYSGTYKHFTKI